MNSANAGIRNRIVKNDRAASHFIFFDYACQTDSTDVKLNEEAEEYVWVTLDEAFTLPVEYYTAVAIREYLRMKR